MIHTLSDNTNTETTQTAPIKLFVCVHFKTGRSTWVQFSDTDKQKLSEQINGILLSLQAQNPVSIVSCMSADGAATVTFRGIDVEMFEVYNQENYVALMSRLK